MTISSSWPYVILISVGCLWLYLSAASMLGGYLKQRRMADTLWYGDDDSTYGADTEQELAGAVAGDLQSFVTNENARYHTGRLANYTAAEQVRSA